jgi:hypothetical protein
LAIGRHEKPIAGFNGFAIRIPVATNPLQRKELMIPGMNRVLSCLLLAALTISAANGVFAADKETGSDKPAKAEGAAKEKRGERGGRVPFVGKVAAVDKTANTITLDGKERHRVIHLTAETRITKAGKPATIDDASVGEQVAGQIVKSASGQEDAVSLRIGPRPEGAEPKPKRKRSEEK